MKMEKITLIDWQKRYGSEEACAETLRKVRWPEGFVCPACTCNRYSYIKNRQTYQCSHCHHQTSVTSGTVFHSTNLSLVKWFWAIYLCASDKGGISALRLSKQIEVSWRTANRILHKIRVVMAHRDSLYRLSGLIESDDAYIGGKKPGKRGRGAEGKKPVLVAVENRETHAGFMAAKAVDTINKENVREFCRRHLSPGQTIRTDAFAAMNAVAEEHSHEKKVTPPEEASTWLPLVHIVIGNLKNFINGTFHGVSHKYIHEYISEFCYRFNRRFWEHELPMRLLINPAIKHANYAA